MKLITLYADLKNKLLGLGKGLNQIGWKKPQSWKAIFAILDLRVKPI